MAALLALGLEGVAQAFREEFPVPDPDPSGADAESPAPGSACCAGPRSTVRRCWPPRGTRSGQVRLPARPVVPPERTR